MADGKLSLGGKLSLDEVMKELQVGEVGVKRTCGAKRTPTFSILSESIK